MKSTQLADGIRDPEMTAVAVCPHRLPKNVRGKMTQMLEKTLGHEIKVFHNATTQLAFIFTATRALPSYPLETMQLFCAPHIWLHIWLQQLVRKQFDIARQLGVQHD
jgi:hypothetical protein